MQTYRFDNIPRVSKYKYIGHIITEDLCDNVDISRQYKIIYAQGNALIRKCYMCTTEKARVPAFVFTRGM